VAQKAYFLTSTDWLVIASDPNAGAWRVTDDGSGGKTFTHVSTAFEGGLVGFGGQMYRSGTVLYVATGYGVFRSADQGTTWARVLGSTSMEGMVGDGQYLYTSSALAAFNTEPYVPYAWASESTGVDWFLYNDQTFVNGGRRLDADRTHHIIYAAAWHAGLFRLVEP
jgi:hypothetical protein